MPSTSTSFIERPQGVWWRKALFQVHLWTGVVIGLYLILISVTGSLLVFQRELQNDVPRLGNDTQPGPLSFGELTNIALRGYPGSALANIDMRTRERRVVSIGLKQNNEDRIVYVDSQSGRIVGNEILQRRHPLLTVSEDLHNELAAGTAGAEGNGIGGALLFVMSVTGIVLWWPGRKNWQRAIKVKWNARWARVNWDLHSAFGFWTLLFVAMWGISGAYFIFPRPFNRIIAVFSRMSDLQERPSAWRPGDPVLPLNALLHRAEALYPHDQLAYLYMDIYAPGGVVKVFLSSDPGMPLPLREDVVSFQPATGQILSNISSGNWSAGERLSLAIYSIHFGDFGGIPVKIIWALLGLIPVLLVITGYLMWWNRVLKKKWQKLRTQQ